MSLSNSAYAFLSTITFKEGWCSLSSDRSVAEKMECRALCEVGENNLGLPFPELKFKTTLGNFRWQSSLRSKAVYFCHINGSPTRSIAAPEVKSESIQDKWESRLPSFFGISPSASKNVCQGNSTGFLNFCFILFPIFQLCVA